MRVWHIRRGNWMVIINLLDIALEIANLTATADTIY